MSDNQTPAVEVKPKSIEEYLKLTKFPEPALKPVTDKVAEYLALVATSNKLVAQINAAKATDPNNVDYLDSLWESLYSSNPEMVEIEAEFQAVTEAREKLLTKLRDFAKRNVPESLSEEKAKEARKQVNEFAPVISESRKAIAAIMAMPESMLTAFSIAIPEGGLVSLLPQAESLKNARGRKAATAGGNVGQYMTRVGEVLIDGTSTNIDGKGKFNYAADKLTERFNGKAIAQNKVTAEDLEEAYWKASGKEFRSVKSTELDIEITFDFEKVTKVQNTNDDGFTDIPQKVRVTVRNPNYAAATEAKPETAEAAKPVSDETSAEKVAEKPAPANQPAKTSVPKIDTRTEAQKANQPTQKK